MGRFEDKIQDIENSILLTLEEAADILDVPVNTIRGWANTGELSSSPIGPRGVLRFRMDDVISFMMR
jgi:excisionase family DNA binding protein